MNAPTTRKTTTTDRAEQDRDPGDHEHGVSLSTEQGRTLRINLLSGQALQRA
jgi:hypothetical protein